MNPIIVDSSVLLEVMTDDPSWADQSRIALVPDFLIGAHAAVRGYDILTRDLEGYRSCFPSLTLLSPGEPAP